MIVAFCIDKYFPYGGLQRDFLRIAQEVVSRGHQVRVYTQKWEGDIPENFDIITVTAGGLTNHGKSEAFSNWVLNHIQKHPVDRVVGFNRMPGLDVYFTGDVCFAEKMKKKNFLYRLLPRYRHYALYEKAVFQRGSKTKILLLTQNHQKDFQAHYQTEDERFFLLPPGIDRNRQYSAQPENTRSDFRKEFKLADNELLSLQVCSNYGLKGVDRSLHAIASLPDNLKANVKFFVVGQDSPEKMQVLASELGISKQVRFFSGRDDIARFMLGADLMLHPARQEAAGIVILESIISGLPIIVSGICGYSHYVDDAKAGVVLREPFNQTEYNQKVVNMLSETTWRQQCAKNAIQFTDSTDLYSLATKACDIILG